RILRAEHAWLERATDLQHLVVDVLDEDLRLVTKLAQQLADEGGLIRSRVAIAEVRQQLMNRAGRAAPATRRRARRVHRQSPFVPIDGAIPVGVVLSVEASPLTSRRQILLGGRGDAGKD